MDLTVNNRILAAIEIRVAGGADPRIDDAALLLVRRSAG